MKRQCNFIALLLSHGCRHYKIICLTIIILNHIYLNFFKVQ